MSKALDKLYAAAVRLGVDPTTGQALNPQGWYTCGCGQWINPKIGVPCSVCREERKRKARKKRKCR